MELSSLPIIHYQIQEQIYEYHQKGLTMDKSAQYSEKNAAKTRRQAQVFDFSRYLKYSIV